MPRLSTCVVARKSPVGDMDTLTGAIATRKQSTRLQGKELLDQNVWLPKKNLCRTTSSPSGGEIPRADGAVHCHGNQPSAIRAESLDKNTDSYLFYHQQPVSHLLTHHIIDVAMVT